MAHQLGCQFPDVLRAQASVTGGLPPAIHIGAKVCVNHPIAAFLIHDSADPSNPYSGSVAALERLLRAQRVPRRQGHGGDTALHGHGNAEHVDVRLREATPVACPTIRSCSARPRGIRTTRRAGAAVRASGSSSRASDRDSSVAVGASRSTRRARSFAVARRLLPSGRWTRRGCRQRFERLRALIRQLALAWPMVGLPGALAGCSLSRRRQRLSDCASQTRPHARCWRLARIRRATTARRSASMSRVSWTAGAPTRKDHSLRAARAERRLHGGARPLGVVSAPVGGGRKGWSSWRRARPVPARCSPGRAAGGGVGAGVRTVGAGAARARCAADAGRGGHPRARRRTASRARDDGVGAAIRRRRCAAAAACREHIDVRSLEAVAIENAVEGCVREAYGALVATHQAARAADPVVRLAMAPIAVDETRHAALSCAVDEWARSRLRAAARRRVDRARRDACEALENDVGQSAPAAVGALAGLPDADAARCSRARSARSRRRH